MNDLPGTIPPASRQLHHRRPPAHKSVSLRHSPTNSQVGTKDAVGRPPTTLSSAEHASDKANPPSVSPKFLSNKYSSGESSDAGKWFESTNNNAGQSTASFTDSECAYRNKRPLLTTILQMNLHSSSATLRHQRHHQMVSSTPPAAYPLRSPTGQA
jgi:hypothetical protein